MARDQQGLTLAGSPGSAEAFDRAVADYYALSGDPVGGLKPALERDPGFRARRRRDRRAVSDRRLSRRSCRGQRRARRAPERAPAAPRRARGCIWRRWRPGPRAGFEATPVWEEILVDFPTDALALRFAQDAYFFLGLARAFAIRSRASAGMGRENPLTSFVLGASPSGSRRPATRPRGGRRPRGVARNPADAWAAHALAHVIETAPSEEGVAFLKASRPSWSPAHFMAGHNGWHLALYLIEQGRFDEVLAGYDRYMRPSSRTTRRSTASTPPRCCGGWNSRASMSASAGRPSPVNGWRMSTTTCSPSTICIWRSPPRVGRRRRRRAAAPLARRLRSGRRRRQSRR